MFFPTHHARYVAFKLTRNNCILRYYSLFWCFPIC